MSRASRRSCKFLEAGVAKGGFETDDVLAALLPLMKQVLAAHEAGLVAPLNGIQDLVVTEQGQLDVCSGQGQFAGEEHRQGGGPPIARQQRGGSGARIAAHGGY